VSFLLEEVDEVCANKTLMACNENFHEM
jgi:hypothetical protein